MSTDEQAGDFGLAGMIQLGYTPEEGREKIRGLITPQIRAIISRLESSHEGRAVLELAAQAWARYGLTPPWEGDE